VTDLLFIEQALHGYLDGHQLLAGSTDLTAEEQSLLLIMSDLSGPAFRTGYETYLTGYALPRSPYYCVARTWFAPELPRPGCVWTQSLLIRAEDLARISNFDHLNALFSHPGDPVDLEWYQQRVVMDLSLAPVPRPPTEGRPVLRGIYGTDKRIVIPSETADYFEPLILGIFEQQWPRLRRNFRFCTGALSLRDTEFDLSVSPPEVTHAVSDTGLVISEKALQTPEREDDWLALASRDLSFRQSKSEFREFLWRFGPDNMDGRAAFRPLAEVFSVLSSKDDGFRGERLLSATNYFYPTPTLAVRLKGALFGRTGRFVNRVGLESDLLRLLVTHPNASSLPDSAMDLTARSAAFAADDPATASDIAIMASEMGGDNADRFLEGYFSREVWPDKSLKDIPPVLLFRLIGRHPNLIERSAIWSRRDSVSLVTRLLPALSADTTSVRRALSAMAEAGAWDAVLFALRNLGERAATDIFALIDAAPDGPISLPDPLIAELAERQDTWSTLSARDVLGPRSLRLLSSELDPRSYHVRRVGAEYWARLLGAPAMFENATRQLRSWVFCLALGLSSDSKEASPLVRESFKFVYDAGLKDALQGRLWQELEPHLAWYSPSWDKCARLVRSVAKAYYDRSWSAQDMLETFSTADLLTQALREIDSIYRGYRFIRKLREEVTSGYLTVTAEQRRVLIH
jgi:hypothetical protein